MNKPGLVIGSGIAGTVAAMALQKAAIATRLLEARAAAADDEGAFLTLAVNGIEALAAIDLDAATFGGFDTPRFSLELGDGTRLAEVPSGPARANGVVSQTIKRGDLYRALRRAAEARGIAITYGKKLVDVERNADGVVARFADGTSEEGAFLVAADGLHSRVRRLLDPRVPPPRYLGLLNAGGFARGVDAAGSDVGTMHFVFGKRCFLGWVRHPDGSIWWFANPSHATEPTKAELATIDWRARLLDLFRGDAAPGADLVRATDTIFAGWVTYDLPRVPRWHDGRMILIGDAAHAASPSSGQGASMAIEDAVVLARCLRDGPSTEEAFDAYERLRRARVERMVAQGKRNGVGKTPGPFGRVVRDAFLKMLFRRKHLRDPMAWIYEHPIVWHSTTTDGV